MDLALVPPAVVLGWWFVCARWPRLGVPGTVGALVWLAVAWVRERHQPTRPDGGGLADLGSLSINVLYGASMIGLGVALVIGVVRWIEAGRDRPRPGEP